MTNMIHRNLTPETYQLYCQPELVGFVRKTEGGFYVELLLGESTELRTMAGVKDWAASFGFEGVEERASRKPTFMTVDQARRLTGLSHTKTNYLLWMVKKCWPWVRRDKLGITIAYLQMVELAKWPRGADARAWLEKNTKDVPKLREVDWDLFNTTGEVLYTSR